MAKKTLAGTLMRFSLFFLLNKYVINDVM